MDVNDVAGFGKISEVALQASKDLGINGALRLLFKPAATELGFIFEDIVKEWREKNTLRILQKVDIKIEEKQIQINPNAINRKLLCQWVEGAGSEDDENIQEKWANLLVSVIKLGSIHPRYLETLRLLHTVDANILDLIVINQNKNHINKPSLQTELQQRGINITEDEIDDSISNIRRLDLCMDNGFFLTDFGKKFMYMVSKNN